MATVIAGEVFTWLAGAGVAVNTATAIGTAVGQLATAVVLGQISQALTSKQGNAQDQARQLSVPTNLPAYRFVYGDTRATGTPVAWAVRGKILYACYLLNSRPSDLDTVTVYADNREVTFTGDPYTFSGAGAVASASPFLNHCNFWIGRGDQTAPPATILSEAPWASGTDEDLFRATDAWKGRTVLWMRADAGKAAKRAERWPSFPPNVEVKGEWTKVYDMRDVTHDPDDASTWAVSDNQGLVLLDALRFNPVRQYKMSGLLPDMLEWAADVADEVVDLNSGGSEPRYRATGTVVFSPGVEVEDVVKPILAAGASRLVRVGGKLGVIPGVARASAHTIDDMIGSSLSVQYLKPSRDLPTQIRCTYRSASRGYEMAELSPWDIPGADTSGGERPQTLALDMVESATQAMRLRKITGLDAQRQKQITGTLPPKNFDMISGAVATVDLAAPFTSLDGDYEITAIHPMLDPLGSDEGVAMRLEATLLLEDTAKFAWDETTDEETVYDEPFDPSQSDVAMPGAISITSGPGVDIDNGGSIIPRFRFEFAPSASSAVVRYEWEWRLDGGDYQAGGSIDADVLDAGGDVFGFLLASSLTVGHDIQVRAVVSAKKKSDWREISGAIYDFELSGVTAAAGPGRAEFDGTAPDSDVYQGVKVYRNSVDDFATATAVSGIIATTKNAAFSVVAGDADAATIITNGDFATDTVWVKGAGWTIASGVASKAPGSSSRIDQTATMTEAAVYRYSVTIINRTAGNIRPRIGGGATVTGNWESASFVSSITASTAPTDVGVAADSSFDGDIDDVLVFQETTACLTQGQAYFWIVPVTLTGSEGAADGPHILTIP